MKRIIFFIVCIISLFTIQNLVRSIYNLWQKHDLIVRAEQELSVKKKENAQLKKNLEEIKSTSYIEKEARDKLFLLKPGETRVVIDNMLLRILGEKDKKEERVDTRSNPQKWWDFFF